MKLDENSKLLDSYQYVVKTLMTHLSECINCDCKFIDVLSSLDLEDPNQEQRQLLKERGMG